MRQTDRIPLADPTKFATLCNAALVRTGHSLPIARVFTATASANWRCTPSRMAHSFGRTGIFAALAFLFSIPITAQDSVQLSPARFNFTPLVGYRSSMGLPIQSETPGNSPALSLKASPAYGFAVGFRIRDEDLIEFRWMRQGSYAQLRQANVAPSTIGATTDQFHCDFIHEYAMPYQGDRVRPYIVGSVGATNIFSGSSFSSAHISVGIGGGFKFFVSRHVGFRMQAEWLPMFVQPRQPIPCASVCVVDVG